jgi:hypothetical protein
MNNPIRGVVKVKSVASWLYDTLKLGCHLVFLLAYYSIA